MEGTCVTVLGFLPVSELGKTLCHEHLYINAEALHVEANPNHAEQAEKDLGDIENQHWLRYFPYSHKKNLHVEKEAILTKELLWYKESGGKTIVDVTITGLRPELSGSSYAEHLVALSKETGVHIICGTGFYVNHVHPEFVEGASIEELADFMVQELTVGIQGTEGIRAGVIGEIGCSWPLTSREQKVLQASALAQSKTGAPLIIHPGRDEGAPMQIVNVLKEAGADISHTVMSHLDRTLFTDSAWNELAETGIYLELDLFGIECSYYQQSTKVYMPHDGQRLDRVLYLINQGFSSQILLSHDIHTNHRLRSFGGHGFSHIFERIIPRLIEKDVSEKTIEQITVINPAKWLQFRK